MQRKNSRQSPAPPQGAKDLVRWVKERGICAACGDDGGVIAHHIAGSSAKVRVGLDRAHIGPWAVNGLCESCDNIVTHQSRGEFRMWFGNECDVWANQIEDYEAETGAAVPDLIKQGAAAWGK